MTLQPESMALPEVGIDDIPAEELYHDPSWLLYCADTNLKKAYFVHLTREMYYQSCFLDPRMANQSAELHSIRLPELEATHSSSNRTPANRFIFHTAFCCSSLLARSLDVPGETFAIREPTILVQIANAMRDQGNGINREMADLLPLALSLLNKPFGNETAFIKPTNMVLNCVGKMLDLDRDSRGIILYGELEDFIISALKRPRQSRVQIPDILRRFLADPVGLEWQKQGHDAPSRLAEQAALVWYLEMRQIDGWLHGGHAKRLRTLSTDRLLSSPVESLSSAARQLDLPLDQKQVQNIIDGPIWRTHSKTAEAYSPAKRSEEKQLARSLFGSEISAGLAYREKLPEIGTIPPELDLFHDA